MDQEPRAKYQFTLRLVMLWVTIAAIVFATFSLPQIFFLAYAILAVIPAIIGRKYGTVTGDVNAGTVLGVIAGAALAAVLIYMLLPTVH